MTYYYNYTTEATSIIAIIIQRMESFITKPYYYLLNYTYSFDSRLNKL